MLHYEKGMCVSYVNVYGVQSCTVIAVDLDECRFDTSESNSDHVEISYHVDRFGLYVNDRPQSKVF